MLTNGQLLARRNGIGGSDVAAIFGLSDYRTALDVYFEKIGESQVRQETKNHAHGNIMEPVILDQYEKSTGLMLIRSPETISSRENQWMIGNLDAISEKIVVDAKYMSRFSIEKWGQPGTDQMPDDVLLQMIHYAIIVDAERVDVAVFFDRPELFIYHYHRDDKLEKIVIEREKEFWEKFVLTKTAPEPQNSSDARNLWKESRKESFVVATESVIDDWSKLRDIKKTIKVLEKEKEVLESKIMIEMKEAEKLIDTSGFVLATWSNQQSTRFDQSSFKSDWPKEYESYKKTCNSRVLRIKTKEELL